MSLPSTETLDQLDDKNAAEVVAAWETVRFGPEIEKLRDKVLNLVPRSVETRADTDFDEHCPELPRRQEAALQGAWRLARYTAWAVEPGHLAAAKRPSATLVAVIEAVWSKATEPRAA